MISEFNAAAIEQIYTLICQNERILKRDLTELVGGIGHTLLDDILFFLKVKRGIFVKRNIGIFKDYDTYKRLTRR